MKNIEKLKEEQQELKERLKRLIDFMNSEEFFTVPDGEKSLLNSQRAGMEMYLNALTNRIYAEPGIAGFSSSFMLPLMMSVLNTSTFSISQSEKESKKNIYIPDEEKK
jgi:hypothetical protein